MDIFQAESDTLESPRKGRIIHSNRALDGVV